MLATVINTHSHSYLCVHLLRTPAEAGPGLHPGDTAVSMTQGRSQELPHILVQESHPRPPPPLAAPAASAVNEGCSSPSASPGLPGETPSPPGSGRPPSWHLKMPWLGGWCLGLVGTLASPWAFVFLCVTGEVRLAELWGSQRFPTPRPEPHGSLASVWGGPEGLLRFEL